jgi:hypothetical protein
MTVQELIELLQQVEDKSKICLADDGHGGANYEIQSVDVWENFVEIR